MPQSLVKNVLHLIYSTKHRRPDLNEDLRPKLFAYKAGVFNNLSSPAITIGGIDDHVHVLFSLSKNEKLKDVVEAVKTATSKWIKEQSRELGDFHWQGGYAAFSVSESLVADVADYIRKQEEHHRKRSFQDELRELLERHGVEFDERYLWD